MARKPLNMAQEQAKKAAEKFRKNQEYRKAHYTHIFYSKKRDSGYGWLQSRGLKEYNAAFKYLLKRSIVDELVTLAQKRRGPLRILDDGAGYGNFLTEVKQELRKRKIHSRTTAVVLQTTPELRQKKRKRLVDVVVQEDAATFVPQEPQDAIFSVFGGFNYLPSFLKKETLLKYAHSLRKGGIGCFGFWAAHNPGADNKKLQERIKKTFEKQGFLADFYKQDSHKNILNNPNMVLIIRRIQ